MKMVLVDLVDKNGMSVMTPDREGETRDVFIEEVDNREIMQDGDDWVCRKIDTGEVVDRYSFDIRNWEEKDIWGDYEAETDKSDLFLLREGSKFSLVYGYEPAYRDVATGLLVFKCNRELTLRQHADARNMEAGQWGIDKHKLLMTKHSTGKNPPVVGEKFRKNWT